jgi:DNA gyrase/topoisomerase IV subunit A
MVFSPVIRKRYKLLIGHVIDRAVYELQTQSNKEDNFIIELIVSKVLKACMLESMRKLGNRTTILSLNSTKLESIQI